MSTGTAYQPRPIKRSRRTQAEIEGLKDAIYEIVQCDAPMTCRQVFYRCVTLGLIPKTEAAYKNTVVRLLGVMRKDGWLPYSWIADSTRWMRRPNCYSGLGGFLSSMQQFYRRDLWEDQDEYVEIWLEKDSLSGVIYSVTSHWQVPLMVCRGYPSLSFLSDAAETIEDMDKPAVLYYLGDRDPSGVDIPRFVEDQLCELAPNAEIDFRHVAVTVEQIEKMKLPTRPTKSTDTRSKHFQGRSVELDAIPPDDLRALVQECIESHIDGYALQRNKRIETLERQTLDNMAAKYKLEASAAENFVDDEGDEDEA